MPDDVKEMMGLLPGRSYKEGIPNFTVTVRKSVISLIFV